jgi:hypothetical protein
VRCYTQQECEEWLSGRQRQKPDADPSLHKEHVHYPRELGRILYLARWVAMELTFREPALLWITEWSIWDENWHLYYRLRHSYGDHRLLHEAPGHFFLEYETEDLASFLQVAIMNG